MRRQLATTILLAALCSRWARAAPLFPDAQTDHWARDAVAGLAARGLLEGYPDGTFKGDRASTRWELAMTVSRLLAQWEQKGATTVTRAELMEVDRLAKVLHQELDALGARVNALKETQSRLDERVSELERISFYGSLNARVTSFNLVNSGRPAIEVARAPLAGTPATLLDYNAAVGSALGAGGLLPPAPKGSTVALANFNPFALGVLSTTNWGNGRPLLNGTGFSMKAILGLKIKVSDDLEGGMEFASYTAQGSDVVDAYYGVSAPYLSNPFTSTVTVDGGQAGLQGLNNQPFSRLTLDHAWLLHKPSQTRVRLGAFPTTRFSSSVYAGMLNPNVYGPEFLDNFGLQVQGQIDFHNGQELYWEVMGTKLPDGNAGALRGTTGFGQSYWSHAEGLNLRLAFDQRRGNLKLNFLHAADDASGGSPAALGLLQVPNLTLNWVNPNGFYLQQMLARFGNSSVAGIGTSSDRRPIPMTVLAGALNPALAIGGNFLPDGAVGGLLPPGATAPNFGGIGPQDQTTLGIAGDYTWDHEFQPHLAFQFAHTLYTPQKGSGYSTSGNALKASAGAVFLDKNLEFDVHYLRVDARFDPYVISMPTIGGIQQVFWRSPDFNYFNNLYSLHDTRELPHNRQGFKLKASWKFLPTGKLVCELSQLWQSRTSLQDVRYSAGSLGDATPNTPVLGQSPGFVDPIFGGFSPYTFAASGSNALAVPLENPRGRTLAYSVNLNHKWLVDEKRGVNLSAGVRYFGISRPSNLSQLLPGSVTLPGGQVIQPGLRGEDVNYVDLNNLGWRIGAEYDLTEHFKIRAAYSSVNIYGHFDPLGVSAPYAESIGSARFTNIDITQSWPELGFNWNLSNDLSWGVEGRYYTMRDHVGSEVLIRPSSPATNLNSGPQAALYSAHPFNWEGLQLSTNFSYKF